ARDRGPDQPRGRRRPRRHAGGGGQAAGAGAAAAEGGGPTCGAGRQRRGRSMMDTSAERELLYGEITDALLAHLRAGRQPDAPGLPRRYPNLADELDDHVAQLAAILQCSVTPTETPATRMEDLPRQLGEFRLLREIGRGGMGVVYEAE